MSRAIDILAEVRAELAILEDNSSLDYADGTGGSSARCRAIDARVESARAFRLGRGSWRHVMEEDVSAVLAETDPRVIRYRLLKLAALVVAWVEDIDRRG